MSTHLASLLTGDIGSDAMNFSAQAGQLLTRLLTKKKALVPLWKHVETKKKQTFPLETQRSVLITHIDSFILINHPFGVPAVMI